MNIGLRLLPALKLCMFSHLTVDEIEKIDRKKDLLLGLFKPGHLYSIAALHGAVMNFDSGNGGTTFKVFFPKICA